MKLEWQLLPFYNMKEVFNIFIILSVKTGNFLQLRVYSVAC